MDKDGSLPMSNKTATGCIAIVVGIVLSALYLGYKVIMWLCAQTS